MADPIRSISATHIIRQFEEAGRLAGTVLSGALYQWGAQSGPNGGLIACLWASTACVLVAGLLSLLLPRHSGPRSKPIRLGDLGD